MDRTSGAKGPTVSSQRVRGREFLSSKMPPDISQMREQSILLQDAQEVCDCMQSDQKRREFLREFNLAGWDVDLMRDAIRVACNNIPQSDPKPVISFYPYTI